MATWRRNERRIFIEARSRDRDLTAASEAAWNHLTHRIFIKLRSQYRTALKIRGRTPRSRSDRTAIAVRSSRDRSSCRAESTLRPSIDNSDAFGTRSTADRAKIVGKSWSENRGNGKPFDREIRSKIDPNLKPQHRAMQTASTKPRFRAHDRLHRPRFQA